MPRILHVITAGGWGGLEQYVATLIKEMSARGISVAAYCIKDTPVEQDLRSAGIPIYYGHRQSHFSASDIAAIRRIARDDGFNTVHSHTRIDVWAVSLALFFTRVVHVNSTYMVVTPKRDLHHWLIYRRVDAITSSSRVANRKLRECFPISKDKIKLIRYGRDLQAFVRSDEIRRSMRSELGIADDELAFGIVGRVEKPKGHVEFAQSLLDLAPDIRHRVKYVVVGIRDDAERDPLNDWVREFAERPDVGGRMVLIGFRKNVIPYLDALDCLVLASHCEMYALSVLEAMAMSLPVIGTNTEGTPEQIEHGRGTLVDAYSSRAIADAVTRYVENPDLRKQHGAAGHEWVHREHAMENTIAAYQKLYNELLAKRLGRRPETTDSIVAGAR